VRLDEPLAAAAAAAHCTPQPRVAEGLWLGASRHVHAMMDCSDGPSTDLLRLTSASAIGLRVERVPVAPSAAAAARQRGFDPHAYALAGGEDFELLVAIDRRAFAHLARRFHTHFGKPLERMGEFRADARVTMVNQGGEEPITRTGWDHFASEERIK
jgi:thiamine-monophosphate kinase